MIIEAAVVAVVLAGGGFLARTLMRRRSAAAAKAAGAAQDARPRSGLSLGDVVLYLGDELWLAGCAELDEEGFVMRLFRCPGGREATHVVQLDLDGRELVLAKDVARDVPAGALPSELRVGTIRYVLRKRGAARIIAKGERVLGRAGACRYACFVAPGSKHVIVLDPEGAERLSLGGDAVLREMVEVLPGSQASQPEPPGGTGA